MNMTWDDIVRERNRREDEPIRRKFAAYKHLGRGHLCALMSKSTYERSPR